MSSTKKDKDSPEVKKLLQTVVEIEIEIKQLQSQEQSLLNHLASLPAEQSPHQQIAIMDQLTNTQNEKIRLFGSLVEINSRLRAVTDHQSPESEAQMQQIILMNQQLDAQKKRIQELRGININNLRLTENNYYYNDLYLAYQDIFKLLIIMAAILLLISSMRQSGMLDSGAVNFLAGITIVIFVGMGLWKGYNIWRRNNMVFAEFDFNAPNKKKASSGDNDQFGSSINLLDELRKEEAKLQALAEGACIGEDCCTPDHIHYSKTTKTCEPGKKEKKDSSKETFISGSSGGCGGFEYQDVDDNSIIGSINSNLYSIN